jgi:hypothetical protein
MFCGLPGCDAVNLVDGTKASAESAVLICRIKEDTASALPMIRLFRRWPHLHSTYYVNIPITHCIASHGACLAVCTCPSKLMLRCTLLFS